jgi:methanogenic corrinoid protein MtbC1
MLQALIEAFADMHEPEVMRLTDELLTGGTDPAQILDACRQALDLIGQRFEAGEAFVPELVMAGEMMGQITARIKPHLSEQAEQACQGTVLMGPVEGDIHDIGKDVVVFMLEAGGFKVVDLGVDVSPPAFVDAIRDCQPEVVGLSGLLTLAFTSMKETVDAIQEAGLRDSVPMPGARMPCRPWPWPGNGQEVGNEHRHF